MNTSVLFKHSLWDDTDTLAALLDIDGRIVDINPPMAASLGKSVEDLKGTVVWQHLPPQDRTTLEGLLHQATESGKSQRFESMGMGALCESVLRPCYSDSHEVIGVTMLTMHGAFLTERKQVEGPPAIHDARRKLAMEAAQAGSWEWELSSNRNVWSDELWGLYGVEPHSCEPSSENWLRTIHPEDRANTEKAVLETVRVEGELNLEWRVLKATGGERWLMSRGRPLRDSTGRVTHYLGVVIDISERKRMEGALKENQRRLLEAQRIARMGNWDWNLVTGEVHWSPEIYVMSGMDSDSTALTPDALLKVVHPDDLEKVKTSISLAVSKGAPADLDYRLVRHDGSIRVIHAVGAVTEHDADGSPTRMVGTNQDITERKQAEEALRELNANLEHQVTARTAELTAQGERLRQALQMVEAASTAGKVVLGQVTVSDGSFICSANLETMLGYPTGGFGRSLADWEAIIHPDDASRVRAELKRLLEGAPLFDIEYRVRRKDGTYIWWHGVASAERDEDGKVIKVIGTVVDITERKAAEERIKESEQSFATMFRSSPIPAIVNCVETGLFVDVNEAFLSMYGFEREEVIGRSSAELGVWPKWEQRQLLFERLEKEDGVSAFEATYRAKSGRTGDALVYAAFIKLNGKRHVFGMVVDDTERRRVENQLRFQGEILAQMQEGVNLVRVSDGCIVYTNPKYEKMLGYGPGELIGQHISVVNDPVAGQPQEVAEKIIRALNDTGFWEGDVANRRKDGTTLWNHIVISNFSHSGFGEVWVTVVNDITARMEAEAKAQLSNERHDELVRRIPSGVYQFRARVDGSVRFDYASERTAELLGITVEEMQSDPNSWSRCAHPDEKAALATAVAKAVEDSSDFDWAGRFLVGGTTRWLRVHGTQVTQSNGDLVWSGVVNDITESRNYQQKMEHQAALMEGVFNAMPDIVFFKDKDGVYLNCNTRLTQALGCPKENILGKTDHEIFPREAADAFQVDDNLALQSPEPVHLEERLTLPDGSPAVVDTLKARVVSPTGEVLGVLGVARDITERKRLEIALRESEDRYRGVVEDQTETICRYKADGTYTFVNEVFCKLFGKTSQELVGAKRLPQAVEEDLGLIQEKLATLSPANPVVVVENRIRSAGGVRYMQFVNRGFFDAEGRLVETQAVGRDITERKQMEERLRQSQKMEAVGHLAGGMAHEFNNILASMLMNLSLARMGGEAADQQQLMEDLEESCKRSADLIKQLLAFSRQSVMNTQLLNLSEVVAGQTRTLKPFLGERVQVEVVTPDDLLQVKADKLLIEQVLLNLCLNARDAMKDGGRLRLKLDLEQVEEGRAKSYADARVGRFVRLSVSDTGCGMEENVRKRLFEPFFTTKDVGKGTGLGLATARGIVQQHQGWVEVDTEPGKGSTFRVYLPAVEPAAPSVRAPSQLTSQPGSGSGTILVAEDNAKLRKLSVTLLTRRGYRVLEAEDGASALVQWAAHRDEIDLLYSDMVMPGDWSGLQLAERFRAEKPTLKVIITSGYNTDIVDIDRAVAGSIAYLPKPCPPDVLLDLVRRCLQAKAAGE